jgi:7,8-dihydropterin-6-yl-methyl-4-(beta-D-ribofuranosyl)aminobenzene 5'-phosphate synthase
MCARLFRLASTLTIFFLFLLPVRASQVPPISTVRAQVHAARITILSTQLADDGIGEWGFSALLEADGHRVLIDTGERPTTVLENARELHLDLSNVEDVVLTHFHWDHVGGLMTLRRELMKAHPEALSRVHVARGIFYSRPLKNGGEGNSMIAIRREFETSGGHFIEHAHGDEILPGVWLTGPVPREFPERNWSLSPGALGVQTPEGLKEDNIPDDQSVVLNTPKGLIVITGCGHAGIVNILTDAAGEYRSTPVYAVIGGLHLFAASNDTVNWTADKMKTFGVAYLIGAHCTGIESLFRLRERMRLTRQTAVVGAVGASFVLGEGIHPGQIAQ